MLGSDSVSIEWFVAVDPTDDQHILEALQERLSSLQRAAEFIREEQAAGGDAEARVWIDTVSGPVCVGVTWEPGPMRFAFFILDGHQEERLAYLRVPGLECVGRDQAEIYSSSLERANEPDYFGHQAPVKVELLPPGSYRVDVEP